MSDQDNIFGGTTPAQAPEGNQAPAPEPTFADKLKGITNEAGEQKYRDVDTALDALGASQQYIPQLQSELDATKAEAMALKAEIERMKGFNEAIESLQTPQQAPQEHQPAGLDEEKAAELFEQMVAKREQKQMLDKNITAVAKAMQEKFGEKAEEMFYGKAQELGMSREAINSLAGTSPAAVLAYFGTKSSDTGVDVSAKTSIYIDPDAEQKEIKLNRNQGRSVLGGSTTADVREEYNYNKELVAAIHKEGGTVEELSDPKQFAKYFGNI
jgi:hypothetical protein